MPYVPLRQAVAALGLHPNTLRRYADNGIIPSIRTPSGRRLFDIDHYLKNATAARIVLYARVSSAKQRDDLIKQIERLQRVYPNADVIQDIASGLNFKRQGLHTLLEFILRGDKLTLVVTHRDRLARFGFELFQFLIEKNGGDIVVLDSTINASPKAELTADLLAILHHFSCRMHGRRGHQSKTHSHLSDG